MNIVAIARKSDKLVLVNSHYGYSIYITFCERVFCKMKRRWAVIGLTAMLSLSLAACGDDSDNTNESSNAPVENSNDSNNSSTNTDSNSDTTTQNNVRSVADAPLSLEEAKKTFESTYQNADISSIELDEDNGQFFYEIKGIDAKKEYEVKIDENNKVVEQKEEKRDMNDDEQKLMLDDYVTAEKAIDTAQSQSEANGLTPSSWSLDHEKGQAQYQVNLEDGQKEVEVTIDAKTGDKIAVEVDD